MRFVLLQLVYETEDDYSKLSVSRSLDTHVLAFLKTVNARRVENPPKVLGVVPDLMYRLSMFITGQKLPLYAVLAGETQEIEANV